MLIFPERAGWSNYFVAWIPRCHHQQQFHRLFQARETQVCRLGLGGAEIAFFMAAERSSPFF
jgi:hypothetical protein